MATQGFIELGGFGALVDPQTVPRTGQDVRFRAGEGELDDLRQSLELGAARSASADLELRRRSGGGIEVSGRVRADVDQICVVSLDPFETAIDERVLVTFYPPEKLPAPDADAPGDDSEDTEPLEDGMLPLGALGARYDSARARPLSAQTGRGTSRGAGAGRGKAVTVRGVVETEERRLSGPRRENRAEKMLLVSVW